MKYFAALLFLFASFNALNARDFPRECVIDENPREIIFCSGDKKYRTFKPSNRTEFIGRCKCNPPKPEPKHEPKPKQSSKNHEPAPRR